MPLAGHELEDATTWTGRTSGKIKRACLSGVRRPRRELCQMLDVQAAYPRVIFVFFERAMASNLAMTAEASFVEHSAQFDQYPAAHDDPPGSVALTVTDVRSCENHRPQDPKQAPLKSDR
jgi:hypothetical protein